MCRIVEIVIVAIYMVKLGQIQNPISRADVRLLRGYERTPSVAKKREIFLPHGPLKVQNEKGFSLSLVPRS